MEPIRQDWCEDHLKEDYERIIAAVTRTNAPCNVQSNCVLTSADHEAFQPSVAELQRFEPEMVSRKSPLAVAQNAFIFRQVQSIARKDDDILLVGGYDDPTGPALSKLGFQVRIIDPKIDGNEARNIWLETLLKTGRLYDIIASCSVMEHVPDDVSFVYHLYALLKPGGIAFLTGPFQEVEEDEEDETEEIIDPDLVPRLYTVNRLDNLVRHVPERALLDAPTWDRCDPDLCRDRAWFLLTRFPQADDSPSFRSHWRTPAGRVSSFHG